MALGPMKRLRVLVKAMGPDGVTASAPIFSEGRTLRKKCGVLLGDTCYSVNCYKPLQNRYKPLQTVTNRYKPVTPRTVMNCYKPLQTIYALNPYVLLH